MKQFNAAEDAVILEHYRMKGAAGIRRMGLLINRSRAAIKARAHALGVKHHLWEIEVVKKPERWWDYPVLPGAAPMAVLA